MLRLKTGLLCATVIASGLASVAQAQIALPTSELRGVGATAPGDILVRSLNCLGQPGAPGAGLNQYGTPTPGLATITPGNYAPTAPSASNPALDCSTTEIQPNFQGKYVGIGSGGGRNAWALFTTGTGTSTGTPSTVTIFDGSTGKTNPFGTWTNVQFAFSESPVSNTNANDYAIKALPTAGPAIAVPFFVVPIAISYNPVYGYKSGSPLSFNLKSTYVVKDAAGNPTGGLHLSRQAYCKIFNGEITNFNDPILKTLNANQSLQDTTDSSARWTADGVPIRLVGRFETSGTTNAFTRHLAAVCGGTQVTTNYFTQAADALPYNPSTGPNMLVYASNAAYKSTNGASTFAGSTTRISGAFYDPAADQILTTAGSEAPGFFIVADGNSGVAAAVNSSASAVLKPSASDATTLLNGKLGYNAGDWVKPTPGRVLFSASLQQNGTGSTYLPAIAKNATSAFGLVLPPQTTATSGAWNTADARTNPFTGLVVKRSVARDWLDVLYPTSGATLANPAKGYPITATSQLLTYTCFATQANQLAMGQFIGVLLGKVTKKANATSLSPNTFKGVATTSVGILTQSNSAVVPAAWVNAISETFLKYSTQLSGGVKLGDQNLWIQNYAPTKLTDFDGATTGTPGPLNKTEVARNPACTSGVGA